MRVEQEKVRLFHEKNGFDIARRPQLVSFEVSNRRRDFMLEEVEEYTRAVENNDLVGIADALADQLYILLGTAVTHGIDLQEIFDEVHRSNMTKEGMHPVTKKGGKTSSYEPPRLADLLFMQQHDPEDTRACPTCRAHRSSR